VEENTYQCFPFNWFHATEEWCASLANHMGRVKQIPGQQIPDQAP